MEQVVQTRIGLARVGAPTSTRILRNLALLGFALAFGAVSIWQLRQDWAKEILWPWLLLLLAMVGAAQALRQLEVWLPGEPVFPRLVSYPARGRQQLGAILIAVALGLAIFAVWSLWPDYRQWQSTPRIWLAS